MEITSKGDFREAEFSFVHLQRTSWTCHSTTVQINRALSCRRRGGRGQLEDRTCLYCPYGQLTGLVNFMVTLSLHWTSVTLQIRLQTLVLNCEQGGHADEMDSQQQAL